MSLFSLARVGVPMSNLRPDDAELEIHTLRAIRQRAFVSSAYVRLETLRKPRPGMVTRTGAGRSTRYQRSAAVLSSRREDWEGMEEGESA